MTSQLDELPFTQKQLEMLITGFGDAESIRMLRRGQQSRTLQNLAAIVELAPPHQTRESVDLIELSLRTNELDAIEALTYPHVNAWATVCLDALTSDDHATAQEHLEHLSRVAAAVALRAGVDYFTISLSTRNGSLLLPGVGRAHLDIGDKNASVVISRAADKLVLRGDAHEIELPCDLSKQTLEWDPIRTIETFSEGLKLTCLIDDLDLYRDRYAGSSIAEPLNRLDDVGFKTWWESIADAWTLLTAHHFDYAIAISSNPQVLVPIVGESIHRHDRAASAFGSIALTNVSPQWITYALLEEFQRAKLSGLHNLKSIYKLSAEAEQHFAPWNARPNSMRKIIESYYALPATASYWNTQAVHADTREEQFRAALTAATWQHRLPKIHKQIVRSNDLTEFGQLLIEGARSEVSASSFQALQEFADEIDGLAAQLEQDRAICWRLQNLALTDDTITALLKAWVDGSATSLHSPIVKVHFRDVLIGCRIRERLTITRLGAPSLFAELLADEVYFRALHPTAVPSDLLVANNQIQQANQQYLESLSANLDDLEAWAGFAGTSNHETLLQFPEIVCDVYRELHTLGESVDPFNVADWLAPQLQQLDNWAFYCKSP